MKRNELLFNLVASVVEADEGRYNQETWGNFTDEDGQLRELNAARASDYHPCNTTACIAGNAIVLATSQLEMVRAIEEASRKLATETYGDEPCPNGLRVTLAHVLETMAEGQGFRDAPIQNYAADLLGLDGESADLLFGAGWFPRSMEVPTALRLIGQGANVTDVTYYPEEQVRAAMEAGTSVTWMMHQKMANGEDGYEDDGTYDGDEG